VTFYDLLLGRDILNYEEDLRAKKLAFVSDSVFILLVEGRLCGCSVAVI
jgi:hypothetical protein